MTSTEATPQGRPRFNADQVAQRRRHIVDTTLRLVAAHGAAGVRLRDVAVESGVSIGLIQHYFESRDALMREAFRAHTARVVADVEAALSPDDQPWDRIRRFVTNLIGSQDLRWRCQLWIAFAAESIRDEALRDLMRGAYESWRAPLARAIADGVMRGDFTPRLSQSLATDSILALVDGYELALAIGDQDDPERVASQVIAAVGALLDRDPD